MTDEIADLLLLCSIPRIGSQRVRNLINRFHTPKQILSASTRELIQVEGIEQSLASRIKNGGDAKFVEQQLALLAKHNVQILTWWQQNYPPLMKTMQDAPVILFYKGNTACLHKTSIAVVGTRAPSTYGKMITEKFVTEFSANDLLIVSGLARGIDTIAHETTVRSGGSTVAVLGSGLDKIYPFENSALADHILQNGILLSEFPMGKKPDAVNFPRRNRIIAGIAACTLVVEAGYKSGALITADFALEHGREVFAIPGNINSSKSLGTNRLIQQGATPALAAQDIQDVLISPIAQQKLVKPHVQLTGAEKVIFDCLSDTPMHIDTISQQCNLSTAQALAVLLTLELKSLVQQISGKNFLRM